MPRDRRLIVVIGVIGAALLGACSEWDPTVGVRCDQFPSFCRPVGSPTGDAGSVTDAGLAQVVDSGAPVSFARDIRPLMNRSETDPAGPGCSHCHYRSTGTQQGIQEGQLDMTTLGVLRRGGKTSHERIVVPGDPASSAIVQKLRGKYAVGTRMPWSGPPYWADAEIELMANWIAQGARGADDE